MHTIIRRHELVFADSAADHQGFPQEEYWCNALLLVNVPNKEVIFLYAYCHGNNLKEAWGLSLVTIAVTIAVTMLIP